MSFVTEASAGRAGFRRAGWTPDPLARTVLTVDPGLRVGWALAAAEPRTLLAGGFHELNREGLYGSAWRFMVSLLEFYGPSLVVMESYFVAPGAHCGQSIEVRGAIKAAIERAHVGWTQLNPARIRAGLGVKGKLKDTQIREIVCDLFGMPAKYQPDPTKHREVFFPADVFDAAALAWVAEV